ncbi:kinase-like domain [Pyrenophora seminiperda CCB06]|uniref:Kinase-like domain n=1 Tax=Pyrenophora seminiperda CCB06 TaxID=1302712 RepID=A0A3M7M466_9PLEO|nr:kinase-like domain [Pyrenophora seminiperda CCB06]
MMPTLTDEQVDNFAQELEGYITEMRKIPKDTGSETRICNSLGGGIFDFRIQDSVRKVLIFEDEAELNKYLTSDVFIEEENREMISKAHGIKHSIVFTHADLHAVNIRVDDTGKITGIIDWETAGWYPEHWEYVKMRFTNLSCGRWMADVTDVIFTGYREELEADKLIQSHFPGY